MKKTLMGIATPLVALLLAAAPAHAQALVSQSDCRAEQAAMRKLGAGEGEVWEALRPPGVEGAGNPVEVLASMRDTYKSTLSIAQETGRKEDAATFRVIICAYDVAIARKRGATTPATVGAIDSAGAREQAPQYHQPANENMYSPKFRKVPDATHCVRVNHDKYGYGELVNGCSYAIEIAWCSEGSMSFKCSNGTWGFGVVWTLSPGGKYPAGGKGAVHFAACGEANAPPKETGPGTHTCDQKL